MPSNVSFEFEKAKLEYDQANSPEAKLVALYKMQSTAPSHKGGENLRADISKKISLLKKQIEKNKQKQKKKGSAPSIAVRKEGIGQVALAGTPNSGKSTLLNKLTGVNAKTAPYPFTTKKPEVGMMDYFGAKIQIVELPAIVEGSSSGKADGPRIISLARNADAIVIVARNKEEEETVKKELSYSGISLNKKEENKAFKKSITLNAFEETNLEKETKKIFQLLDKIIVYTKKPGDEADYELPLGLPKNATVLDVAKNLHKDFAKKLKYARVWGSSKFPGQRVSKEYQLKNKDIVEVSA